MLKGSKLSRQKENLTILKSVDIELHKGRITGVLSLDPRETSSLLNILSGHGLPSGIMTLLESAAFHGSVQTLISSGLPAHPTRSTTSSTTYCAR